MTIEAIYRLISQTFVAVGNIRKNRRKTKEKGDCFYANVDPPIIK